MSDSVETGAVTQFLRQGFRAIFVDLPRAVVFGLPSLPGRLKPAVLLSAKIADVTRFGQQYSTAEKWADEMEKRFASSKKPELNGDLQALREKVIPNDGRPEAFAYLVPVNNYSPIAWGKTYWGEDPVFLADHCFTDALVSNAYADSRGHAVSWALTACAAMAGVLAYSAGHLAPDVALSFAGSMDSWGGSFGGATTYTTSILKYLAATAGVALPFLFWKRIAAFAHDAIAGLTVTKDVADQIESVGLNLATLDYYSGNTADLDNSLEVKAEQSKVRDYRLSRGDRLYRLGASDGTARARGSLFGVEKGSVIFISAEDSMTNCMTSGRIGAGKTQTSALPGIIEKVIQTLQAGLPMSGLAMCGKSSLWRQFFAELRRLGYDTSEFPVIGLEVGQVGIPLLHGFTPSEAVAAIIILGKQLNGAGSEDFWSQQTREALTRAVHLAWAYSKTKAGQKYCVDNGEVNPWSIYFIREIGRDTELLYRVIDEISTELSEDEQLLNALWTTNLEMALDFWIKDWSRLAAAPETAVGVEANYKNALSPFFVDGEITDLFAKGRTGEGYLDPSEILEGKFAGYGIPPEYSGMRAIGLFLLIHLFASGKKREVRFKKEGIDALNHPVFVIVDEAPLYMVGDDGSATGLDLGSAPNVTRSYGIHINTLLQQFETAVNVVGDKSFDNMQHQYVHKIFHPQNSERAAKWLEETSGMTWIFDKGDSHTFPTQADREDHYGGVMQMPRMKPLEVIVPFNILGAQVKRPKFISDLGIVQAVRMNQARTQDRSIIDTQGGRHDAESNEREQLDRNKSLSRDYRRHAPLFSKADLDGGNLKAIHHFPQFGQMMYERLYVEPIYKKALTPIVKQKNAAEVN